MPGVLIVESLAQAGGITVLSLPENKGKLAVFASIKNAKFKRQVVPGDVLTLKVTMERLRKTGRNRPGGSLCRQMNWHGKCEIMFAFD